MEIEPSEVIVRIEKPSKASLFQAIGEAFAEKLQKPLWIEKTPLHLRYLQEIRQTFPSAPIIQIIRDGRNVALSLCKVEWANDSYTQNLYRWNYEINQSLPFFDSDNNALVIYYEKLVTHPVETILEVCKYLGIDFEERMLIPDRSEKRLIEHDSNIKDNITKPIISDNTNKWAAEISKELARSVQWMFESDLKRHGYSVRSDTPQGYIALPSDWLVHDDPDHMQALPLGDIFVALAARHGLAIRLESEDLFSMPKKRGEAIRILPWKFPAGDIKTMGLPAVVRLALLILQKLIMFKLNNIKYVWIVDRLTKYDEWPLRYYFERLIAKFSIAIVCECNEDADLPSYLITHGEGKLLYVARPDFEQILACSILD